MAVKEIELSAISSNPYDGKGNTPSTDSKS